MNSYPRVPPRPGFCSWHLLQGRSCHQQRQKHHWRTVVLCYKHVWLFSHSLWLCRKPEEINTELNIKKWIVHLSIFLILFNFNMVPLSKIDVMVESIRWISNDSTGKGKVASLIVKDRRVPVSVGMVISAVFPFESQDAAPSMRLGVNNQIKCYSIQRAPFGNSCDLLIPLNIS